MCVWYEKGQQDGAEEKGQKGTAVMNVLGLVCPWQVYCFSSRTSHVDKKLTSARVGIPRIGHGQGPCQIANLMQPVTHFIRNST